MARPATACCKAAPCSAAAKLGSEKAPSITSPFFHLPPLRSPNNLPVAVFGFFVCIRAVALFTCKQLDCRQQIRRVNRSRCRLRVAGHSVVNRSAFTKVHSKASTTIADRFHRSVQLRCHQYVSSAQNQHHQLNNIHRKSSSSIQRSITINSHHHQ